MKVQFCSVLSHCIYKKNIQYKGLRRFKLAACMIKNKALCSHLWKEITYIWYSLIYIPSPTSLTYESADLHPFCPNLELLESWKMKHSLEELPQPCFKLPPCLLFALQWCLKKLFHLWESVKCIQWPFILAMCDRHLWERRNYCILLN